MQLMDGWTQRRKDRLGALRGARNQHKIRARVLVERIIFRWPDLRIERTFSYIFNHADNGPERARRQFWIANLPADRIFAGEILLRERMVDDHDFRLLLVLGVGEVSA